MADWMPPGPNPQTLLSSMLGENIGSRTSESTNEGESGFSFNGHPEQLTNYSDESQAQSAIDQTTRFHGGLLERMAARAGFNAPRLNTETIRSVDLSQNRDVPSPFFTIPTGLSPTTLLESPVFVSNSRAQPSPTTGKLSFVPPSGISRSSGLFTESADRSNEKSFGGMGSSSFFAFRPDPIHFFGSSDRESFQFPSIEVSVQSENTVPPQNLEHSKGVAQNQQEDSCILSNEKDTGSGNMSVQRTTTTGSVVLEHSSPLDEQQDEEADQKGSGDLNGVESPAEDGYNWRKYGQKQVKGSDFPRSYYKCTHTNCPVKKKIERSVQGHITEIIYKGVHNHPKPLPHRKSSASFGDMQLENGQCGFTGGGGDPVWRNVQRGNMASDWRHDNLDVTSSTKFGSQYGNGTKSLPIQNGSQFESGDASSTYSNDEDDDERGTHGSASVVVDDGGGDESESKKRKLEAYAADMSGATRAMREPRVVVQTTSEVDILDDGYRWRKYGQKVVKGNPNPRSYYKCTSAGCSVRKHVERASHDLKSVITTYEGKHNHDVPAARNTSHVNSSSNVQQSQVLKPEPSQFRNSMSQFDRSSNSFGSFGLPNRPLLIPPQDFGYGMTQRNMPNLSLLGGWGGPNHSQGGLGLPFLQGLQYPGQQQHQQQQQQQQQQQRPVNEMELMLPKGEPKVEPVSDSGLSLPNASSIYQQVMSRMPLGPHM